MRIVATIFLAISISFISSGWAQPARDIAQANNKFAFDMYSRLDLNKRNIFFSPYSLSSALTMTYEGAHGPTADEMRMALYLPSDEVDWRGDVSSFIQNMNAAHPAYELSVANALWTQKAFLFKEDYLKLVKDTYFGEARNLDFIADPEASRTTINNWVLEKTKNRIKDLLPPGSIDHKVRLVLTNAVYFKGKWAVSFKKELTKKDAFWISPTEAVQIDMMGLVGKSFKYTENDQVQVVELPYQGNDLSMLIVLGRDKDVQLVEKAISEPVLREWEGAMFKLPVNVFIPKFKFDADYQMKDILKEMGMKIAFDESLADFSNMAQLSPGEHLYIDQVYHKAWIDVNEEGTEAAAATAVVVMAKSLSMQVTFPPKVFFADHPFIFMIRENKTGHILFMGRVSDPREK